MKKPVIWDDVPCGLTEADRLTPSPWWWTQ